VSKRSDDLKATAEDLVEDAERLRLIEQRKLALRPGDPRLAKLAEEANAIVARMQPKARAQKQLAGEGEGA
jgi:hypothetical protein